MLAPKDILGFSNSSIIICVYSLHCVIINTSLSYSRFVCCILVLHEWFGLHSFIEKLYFLQFFFCFNLIFECTEIFMKSYLIIKCRINADKPLRKDKMIQKLTNYGYFTVKTMYIQTQMTHLAPGFVILMSIFAFF